MKWFRSSKHYVYRLNQRRKPDRQGIAGLICALLILATAGAYAWHANLASVGGRHPEAGDGNSSVQPISPLSLADPGQASSLGSLPTTGSGQNSSPTSSPPSASKPGTTHANIITTVFWVGEPADSDNGYISNAPSAWDEQWEAHYGGFDDPAHRNGSIPGAFTPKENPFYIALPYNDFSPSSTRKSTATNCLTYTPQRNDHYSWCKNIWVAVTHGKTTVYAQWEDVGPFQEDDTAYVFGGGAPKNTQDAKAGLDVSPAVRDYLGLGDVDHTSWSFVAASAVPAGPWKQYITTSLGSSID